MAPRLRTGLTRTLSKSRRAIKRSLFLAAVLFVFIALAEPQAGFRWEKVTQRGNDILFAVDTSKSMATPDVKPTRLERAKLAIDSFVDHLSGDAVGLVAFAGDAFIQTPLTIDYGAFRESLAALDIGIVPRGGTNITSAIHAAQQALRARPGSDKILILVTDGEDLEGDSLAAAKAAAAQDGLKIYTVGVGSANGDLIPLPPDQGGGFLKDSAGHLVRSHLDEASLKALAAATGGSYSPLGADNAGLDTIYRAAIAPLTKHALESRAQKIYTQRFQWPLGAAILLLLLSLAVGTRRNPPRAPRAAEASLTPQVRNFAERLVVPALAGLLALTGLLHSPFAQASASASAAAAYGRGDYAAAAKDYAEAAERAPREPLAHFDAGATAYKAGSYAKAAQAFQASVNVDQSSSAKRLGDQEDAYYNLGDALYREGEKGEQSDAQQTIKTWTDSLKAYDAALELRPDDADGKFNRDLVKRKLDTLKKQEQSKNDQSKPNQSAQNQSKSDRSKSDQGKQDQSKPGQSSQPPSQANSAAAQNQSQQNQASAAANDQHGQGKQALPQTANNSPSPGGPQSAKQQPSSGAKPSPANPVEHGGQNANPARSNASGGEVGQDNDDQRTPGGMSREEARELLDSVKDAKLPPNVPSVPDALNATNIASPDEPQKDW